MIIKMIIIIIIIIIIMIIIIINPVHKSCNFLSVKDQMDLSCQWILLET